MASSCMIMADSTCDFSRSYALERHVDIVPFHIAHVSGGTNHWREEQLAAMAPHEVYDAMRSGARLLTSQPSQLEYEEVFEQALVQGTPLVLFCISSGLSGGYNGALIALERVRERHPGNETPVYVVDSLCASTPLQLLVERACDHRDAGWGAEQIYEWALGARRCLGTLFMVDDMEYLYRGGRVPRTAASLGGVLDAHPLLTFDRAGRLRVASVTRGRKKARVRLVQNYVRHHAPSDEGLLVAIGDADAPESALQLKEMIEQASPGSEVLRSTVSPTIGVHVGPGMLSCCFFRSAPTVS